MPVTHLNPYIHFNGNAADAIRHYQQALGAKVVRSMTYAEMPGAAPRPEDASRIMHSELTLGACTIMISDAPAEHQGIVGSNVEVTLGWSDEAEMRRAFDSLVEGGQTVIALHDTFWGGKLGMLVDRFDIHWMFTYGQPSE